MASNEDLMHAIQDVGAKLDAHIAKEDPILFSAQLLMIAHGSDEMIRARIAFINGWMEREKDRSDLRRAIIKHGALLAMTAGVIFVFRAVWKDVLDLIWSVKK